MHEKQPSVIGKKLGIGAETVSYMLIAPPEERGQIAQFYNPLGRVWQTTTKEYIEKCKAAAASHEIAFIRTEVRQDWELIKEGQNIREKIGLQTPFVNNYEEKQLDFHDLTDPEIGQKYIEDVYQLVKDADNIRHAYNVCLDIAGGEMALDLIRAFLPKPLRSTRIRLHNLLKNDGSIPLETPEHGIDKSVVLSDIGMHNLTETGKFKPITEKVYHIAYALTIEILKQAIKHHKKQGTPIDVDLEQKIHDLPPHGPIIYTQLAKLAVPQMLKNQISRQK